MTLILPSAPANFYAPSLDTLKANMEAINGSTKGQVVLITAPPVDIENAWSEVGAAGDTAGAANRGTEVIGNADVGIITGPILGPEEAIGENGYKLQLGEVDKIEIYIDGSGSATATIIGVALVAGIDIYVNGTPDHLKYLLKVNDLIVTDGGLVSLPEVEIIINYSELESTVNPTQVVTLGNP